jgi:membrane protein DedA with SNARE-associated domain
VDHFYESNYLSRLVVVGYLTHLGCLLARVCSSFFHSRLAAAYIIIVAAPRFILFYSILKRKRKRGSSKRAHLEK